jgi:hypothetical protein
MLVACRLAGLSALETYYAGTSVGAQFGAACGCAAQLQRLVQMAAKIRRLARNSKLGDDGGSGSRQTQISFPREQDAVSRLGVRSRHLRFPPRGRWLDALVSAGITPGPYVSRLGGGTMSAVTFRA